MSENSFKEARIVNISAAEKKWNEQYPKKRRFKRVFLPLIIIIVVLTVFLSVMLNDDSLCVGIGNVNSAYGTVLADIDGITVANPRLVDIAMLGSHDAATDTLDKNNPLDPWEEGKALGIIDPISKGMQFRYGKTQTISIYQQLLQGSRWFHIKYTNYNGTWYSTHAHLGAPMEDYLIQILTFLADHPGEIVLVDFQPMYFGEETYGSFHDWVATVKFNGKNLYDYVYYDDVDVFRTQSTGVKIGDLRYNDLTQTGTSAGVVLFDRREDNVYKPTEEGYSALTLKYFDLDANAIHTWHSRLGQGVLQKKISETAELIELKNIMFGNLLCVNQTQGSFSGDIFGIIGNWSLLNFAQKHNATLVDHEDFDIWLTLMPVFQVDFVNSDKGDFNNKVNAKIRTHNERLCADLMTEAVGQ